MTSFFFVHGLGGHAFSSWAEQPNSSSDMVMWPRDLLPTFLLNKEYNGRYSTLGYKANPLLSNGLLRRPFWKAPAPHPPGTTITSAAENLLSILRENKTMVSAAFAKYHFQSRIGSDGRHYHSGYSTDVSQAKSTSNLLCLP